MTIAELQQSGFEKWKQGIERAEKDPKWNYWDCEIMSAVKEFNSCLSGVASYVDLDWRMIKAMVWVETGANSSEWNIKPLQIGVAGDPGLTSLLSKVEGGDLILPPALKKIITIESARNRPTVNIRAGIGYLLMRAAIFEYKSVTDPSSDIFEVVVRAGDSFEKIAKQQGSTTEILIKLNPGMKILSPGSKIKCQRASTKRVIQGWRRIDTKMIADRYNGGGDKNYKNKLDFALKIISKTKAKSC